jgi:hypothetical protein
MSKNNWVPMSEPDMLIELTGGKVSSDLALPVGADEDRVQFHAGRLLKLAHISGSEGLHLTFDYYNCRPDYVDTMHIGGGLAVAKGLRKPPEHYGDFRYKEKSMHQDPLSRAMTRADTLTLSINQRRTQSWVQEHHKNIRGPADEKLWAARLNRSVKATTRDAIAWRFGGLEAKSLLTSRAYTALLDVLVFSVVPQALVSDINTPAEYLQGAACASLVLNGIGLWAVSKDNTQISVDDTYVPSLLAFSKIDRVPLGFARTASLGSVVKCRA